MLLSGIPVYEEPPNELIYSNAGLSSATVLKNPPASARDTRDVGSFSGLGRSPEVRNGNLLQYSCLENSMDRGALQVTVRRAAKSWTQLSTHAILVDIWVVSSLKLLQIVYSKLFK